MTAVRDGGPAPVEDRVRQAFQARAGSVDVPTDVVDERYRELRTRLRDGGRRPLQTRPARVAAVAALTAAAVALFLALAGGDGILTTSPPAPPAAPTTQPTAQPTTQRTATATDPAAPPVPVLGYAGGRPGTAYTALDWHVPLTLVTGELPEWAGTWARDRSDTTVSVGLESAFDTGHPSVTVMVLDHVYAPDQPWTVQRQLVPAPQDGEGWLQWFASSGLQLTEPEAVEVGGVPAQRVGYTVPPLDERYDGCFPGRGCIAFEPLDDVPGAGRQAGLGEGAGGHLYVLEVEGRAVVLVTQGTASERHRWEPVLSSVVASITWS